MPDYLQQGICEDVPANDSEAEKTDAVEYYLPHNAMLREDKTTTKLKVVFDAFSHASLNYCLLAGPNLNPRRAYQVTIAQNCIYC